jgi:hypothetical protein
LNVIRDVVVLVAIAGVVIVGLILYPLVFPCSAQERSVLKEFPHYGNVKPKVIGNADAGGCGVVYDTDASQQRIAKYYVEQLRAHGWQAHQEVAGIARVERTVTTLKEPERKKITLLGVVARRGEFLYTVDFEPSESVGEPGSGGLVAVYVRSKQPS